MDLILTLHSWVRWLIVAVAVIAIAKFAVGWLRRAAPQAMDRGLMSGFSGLVDLQALLGITYLLGSGLAGAGFPGYRIEHAITMVVAVVVAHVPARWRKSEEPAALRNNLLDIAAVLLIIVVGIALLPQGWFGGGS